MNTRFVLLIGGASTLVFAAVWALSAPATRSAPAAPVGDAPAAVYFADCDAVRAAGVAPLRADQPGYRAALDGNMNGVACEPVGGAVDATPMSTDQTAATSGDTAQTDAAQPAPSFSAADSAPTGLTGQSTDTPAGDTQREM